MACRMASLPRALSILVLGALCASGTCSIQVCSDCNDCEDCDEGCDCDCCDEDLELAQPTPPAITARPVLLIDDRGATQSGYAWTAPAKRP
jgi:hypothetical protein